METRAHFVLIGVFTIGVVAAVFLFVLWFAGNEIDRDYAEYEVIFDSAVTGLSKGGDVRYAGIKVGEVQQLSLDKENPSRVVARIRIDSAAPVTTDSKAKLEVQGLTGVAFILITGGGPNSPRLNRQPGQDVPVIRGEPSALQDLVSGVPTILSDADMALLQLHDFLSNENSENFGVTLAKLRGVADMLASREQTMADAIDNLHKVSEELTVAANNFNELTESANSLMGGEGELLVKDMRETLASIRQFSDNANGMLEANSGTIQDFADNGLSQMGPFLTESRQTMETLDRVLQRMESDPARYLSGNYAKEYEAQQ